MINNSFMMYPSRVPGTYHTSDNRVCSRQKVTKSKAVLVPGTTDCCCSYYQVPGTRYVITAVICGQSNEGQSKLDIIRTPPGTIRLDKRSIAKHGLLLALLLYIIHADHTRPGIDLPLNDLK